MDKRSWPWNKKSSVKLAAVSTSNSWTIYSNITSTQIHKGRLDNHNKKPKYVQISIESYTHLTGLEDEVKSYEDQVHNLEHEVKELNEKLHEAHLEMINKENMVKQHAKVAEEAVFKLILIYIKFVVEDKNWTFLTKKHFCAGWEKADTEAAALKNNVESVTLLKLTAEDRASHLDASLNERTRQIQNLKEHHDLKLQEVILSKTRIFDKMKHELEKQIANFEQQLLRSSAENAALSRSLQERSNKVFKLGEDRLQAEAEIERLIRNIESCEKEVNSLKYELHIAKKEVEIRNEEKNMSVRSADVAYKQHLDGVKKIAKLEAECQRLRGLVRKKLPGPAALAQMKLEVENMGIDYGESRVRRSTASSCLKENELLTERLITMDEETTMLKEALAKRNGELQSCRSMYAQTASKLQSLESQLQANGEGRSLVTHVSVPVEGFSSQNASNQPSFASVSECGNDGNVSHAGSFKSEYTKYLGLMDDFLEMEKLANQSHGSHEAVSSTDIGSMPEHASRVGSDEIHTSTDTPSKDGLADVKLQLTLAQKCNSLAETQLKCMTESYKSLEKRAEELQTEVKLLEGKIGNLDLELQDERRGHQDALNRCNDLLDQLQRTESLANYAIADDDKSSQSDSITFPQKIEASIEEESRTNGMMYACGTDNTSSFYLNRTGSVDSFPRKERTTTD